MTRPPVRFQRRRVKGWRKPPGGFVVTRPSRFSNPWRITHTSSGWEIRHIRSGQVATVVDDQITAHREAQRLFADDLAAGRLPVTVDDVRRELAGRDLGCSCSLDLPCHADVLLAVAAGADPVSATESSA